MRGSISTRSQCLVLTEAVYEPRVALLPERDPNHVAHLRRRRVDRRTACSPRRPERDAVGETTAGRSAPRGCRGARLPYAPWRASSSRDGTPSTAPRSIPDEALAPAEGTVDPAVETADWEPLDGVDDGVEHVTFVDGVRGSTRGSCSTTPSPGPDARALRDLRGRAPPRGTGAPAAPRSRPCGSSDGRCCPADARSSSRPSTLEPGVRHDDRAVARIPSAPDGASSIRRCAAPRARLAAALRRRLLRDRRRPAQRASRPTRGRLREEPPRDVPRPRSQRRRRRSSHPGSARRCSRIGRLHSGTPGTSGSRCCDGGHSWTGIVRCEASRPAPARTTSSRSRTAPPRCCRSSRSSRTSIRARRRTWCRSARSSGSSATGWAIAAWSTGRSAKPSANGEAS